MDGWMVKHLDVIINITEWFNILTLTRSSCRSSVASWDLDREQHQWNISPLTSHHSRKQAAVFCPHFLYHNTRRKQYVVSLSISINITCDFPFHTGVSETNLNTVLSRGGWQPLLWFSSESDLWGERDAPPTTTKVANTTIRENQSPVTFASRTSRNPYERKPSPEVSLLFSSWTSDIWGFNRFEADQFQVHFWTTDRR